MLHLYVLIIGEVARVILAEFGVQSINIMYINEERNILADKSLEVTLKYIHDNPSLLVKVGHISKVIINSTDPVSILENLCLVYKNDVTSGMPPHVILDTTMSGLPSEAVKAMSVSLGLPTVSASYGQEGDIRQWKLNDGDKLKYLIQINPPADIIPQIIRSIITHQNITDAGILFDDTFVMEYKYKALLISLVTRHRIIQVDETRALKQRLTRLRDLDINNFFILGRLSTIKLALDTASANKYFGRKYSWHVITQDEGELSCACENNSILLVKPEPDPKCKERLRVLKTSYNLVEEPAITSAFYFDLFLRSILAIKSILDADEWPKDFNYILCEDFDGKNEVTRKNFGLMKHLKRVSEPYSYAPFKIEKNGENFQDFNMKLIKVTMANGHRESVEEIGTWNAGIRSPLILKDSEGMRNLSSVTMYRVVIVKQHPFIVEYTENGETKYKGYCIDLIEEIKKIMGFEYTLSVAPDNKFGYMDDNGRWSGMIKELVEKRADIALGSLSVMAERENVVDFTIPYYDLVGISILMKKQPDSTSLFKFITVLESEVWFCILAAYLFTSFLLWIFDKWSPYSYQNNREKYTEEDEIRQFNLKECLWFCMTSLTPQGGGEAPKNFSGRIVAGSWWLFGFIIIASYTANLAAFLTVSRLDAPIESLDDLVKQYKIQYAPINGSAEMAYFQRMANIEAKFYQIWKEMSLNDSLSEVDRSKLAVWDYPVSDKFTKMWQAMKEARLPNNLDEALQRVRSSPTSSEGFAFIGDATDIRYQVLTDCTFQMIGEEFSRKPYALAVQQGNPVKDQFNNAILQLLNKRKLEKLKDKWWNLNPDKQICDVDDESEGISIHNIGGVFVIIFVGIGLASITLIAEYCWHKCKLPPDSATVFVKPEGHGGRRELPKRDTERPGITRLTNRNSYHPETLSIVGLSNRNSNHPETLSITGLASHNSHLPTFRARNIYN